MAIISSSLTNLFIDGFVVYGHKNLLLSGVGTQQTILVANLNLLAEVKI